MSAILQYLTGPALGAVIGYITNDIAASHQLEYEEAETLKRKHGIAYVAADSDNPQMLPISNDRTLSENTLQNIIGARQEEIIMNVWHQIENVSEKLLAGIIITGGASQLKDMPEAIKHFTHFQKVKTAKSLITTSDVGSGVNAPQGNSIETLIALLMHGTSNCIAEEEPVQQTEEPEVSETVTGATVAPSTDGGETNAKSAIEPGTTSGPETREEKKEEAHAEGEAPQREKKPRRSLAERLRNFGKTWGKMFEESDDD